MAEIQDSTDDTLPVLLKNGKIVRVPRRDIEAALADPAAAPVSEVIQQRADTVPVRLENGQIAQVPSSDYQQAIGDPLAAGGQGRRLVPIPLASGQMAMVPREDAFTAMQDPLSAYGSSASQGADMNGQMDPQMMEILQQYAQEGRLDELFQPYQQEQSVLDQQMQIAQGMRQRGPQRGTPTGALFGGLSNAIGNIGGAMLQKKALEGQTSLGKRQQAEASGRVSAILREMQRRKGIDPSTGMMAPAVDDATLARMFSEGM